MSYETIKLELSDSIAALTFNRPKVLNAINPEMIEEFREALVEILVKRKLHR